MDQFVDKLKAQANENPMLALGIGAAVITSIGKLIDSASAAQGRKAYAKQINHRVKTQK